MLHKMTLCAGTSSCISFCNTYFGYYTNFFAPNSITSVRLLKGKTK